jgi:hypothetical protein
MYLPCSGNPMRRFEPLLKLENAPIQASVLRTTALHPTKKYVESLPKQRS